MKAFINISTSMVLAGVLALSASVKAADAQSGKWVWSDDQGFISTDTCTEAQTSDIGLKISEIPGKAHSIVRSKIGQAKPMTADFSNYIVEVIRSSKEKYLPKHSGLVRGSFWQASMDGQNYNILNCQLDGQKPKFVMFDVFVFGQPDPVAHVGVNVNNMGILNISKVLTVKEVEEQILKAVQAQTGAATAASTTAAHSSSQASDEATQSSSSIGAAASEESSNEQASENSAPVQKPMALVPAAKPAQTQYVVCVHEGTLQVRNTKLNEVVFTAQNMDPVDTAKFARAKKQVKSIDGTKRTFIEVTFPTKAAGENTGWVAQDYISTKAQCVVVPQIKPAPVAQVTKPVVVEPVKPPVVQAEVEDPADASINILAQNCAEEKILSAAKVSVRKHWRNKPRSGGQCALGVRYSLEASGVGDISGGQGDAIDYMTGLKKHGYVDTGIRDVRKAPIGSVIVFGGPYTAEYLQTGRKRHGRGLGNYVGHITIKGDDGFFYTDAREDHPAIGWNGLNNSSKIRNIWGVFVPGKTLIKKYAGKCANL